MSTQVWDVACFVCGHKLGSNKARCGQDGQKKMKRPPCVWAQSDSAIVTKCFRIVDAQKARANEEEELKKRIQDGTFKPNYEEPEHPVDREAREAEAREAERRERLWSDLGEDFKLSPSPKRKGDEDKQEQPAQKKARTSNQGAAPEPTSNKGAAPPPGHPSAPNAAAASAPTNDKKEMRTKWNCMTRTMLFRCIQKFDPFSSPDKAKVWETIAKEMTEATRILVDTADGDFRVYSCGKTLQVFYNRCREKHKVSEDGESHSGCAGKEEVDKSVQEERAQLAACIELERSAKEVVEQKREDKKAFDALRNGEVNDMVINLAVSNDTVRMKAVKVLASKLRAAKMRKLSWEAANKGGKYTYSEADLRDFEQWKQVKEHDGSLPDDPTDGVTSDATTSSAPRGGALAASITTLLEKMPERSQYQPASPQEFASAFWTARSEHVEKTKLSLKDKLAVVDKDVADGTITAEEGAEFKAQIKTEHYKF
jgi:hypothetical protein